MAGAYTSQDGTASAAATTGAIYSRQKRGAARVAAHHGCPNLDGTDSRCTARVAIVSGMDEALVPIAAGLIAAASALTGVWMTQRQALKINDRDRRDALRRAQVDTAVEFLMVAHSVADRLSKCHPLAQELAPLPGEVHDAFVSVDKELSPLFRKVEVTSDQAVVDAASTLRNALYAFREPFSPGAGNSQAPAFQSKEYYAVYKPYQTARAEFVRVARLEAMAP